MALIGLLLVAAALALTFFSGSEAGDVGVCYGMLGDNLIDPPAVVQLLNKNGIKMVTLYDTNSDALHALANSGIKVGVSLPNENLAAAGSMSYAVQWVQDHVQAYPNTLINNVAVGNEVFHQQPQLTSLLLPAMQNIQAALASAGLADAVKVFTPIAMDALKDPSFPPSMGEFRDDLKSVMSPMLDFLGRTGSFISFNIYPYIAYRDHPDTVDFDFVMFRATKYDSGTGLTYGSLYEAMVDAVFHAVEKLSNSRQHATPGRKLGLAEDLTQSLVWREHGFPHAQIGPALKHDRSGLAEQKSSVVATAANAQIYNTNVINKMLRGGGTPYKPNAVISGYIFSLFNEDKKTGDVDERNFGLFYPDGTAVYQVDFKHGGPSPGPAPPSWCTANAAVGNTRLQAALDYACGHGADCSAIQPGKSCYNPNTVVAHASYAFNSYYQSKGRVSGSCDFSGAATVVYQQPTGCDPNAASWCVANSAVGDARLQSALDYACGHGADCSAIQAGGRCFNPNTKVAHASYAFNDYYHKNGQTDQSCSFGGCGSVVHQQPKYGNCAL